jgi:lysophospholipase L1-like esterase
LRLFRFLAVLAVAVTAACTSAAVVGASPPAGGSPVPATVAATWSATWGTAQAQAIPVGPWQAQTLRMVARTSLGGSQVRIHLANTFATSTAAFAHVSVGVQQDGEWTRAVPVPVTFGGSASLTLAPGASAVSDPAALPTTANTRLLVSLYIPAGADITSAPVHQDPGEIEYNYVGSDVTGIRAPAGLTNTFSFTTYLASLDVDTAAPSTLVAVGDSITDGIGNVLDADTRWPDYLAARVAPLGYAVVNEGIVADSVTADQPGIQSITSRWQRDVLSVPGVRTVIDAGGINDLRAGVSAATLEAAQNALIVQAHAAGVRVLLANLTPCVGAPQCTGAFETQREIYNAWAYGGGSLADGSVDFNGAVMSTTAPTYLQGIYDSGDHLHPNPAGYAVMAGIVNASQL